MSTAINCDGYWFGEQPDEPLKLEGFPDGIVILDFEKDRFAWALATGKFGHKKFYIGIENGVVSPIREIEMRPNRTGLTEV